MKIPRTRIFLCLHFISIDMHGTKHASILMTNVNFIELCHKYYKLYCRTGCKCESRSGARINHVVILNYEHIHVHYYVCMCLWWSYMFIYMQSCFRNVIKAGYIPYMWKFLLNKIFTKSCIAEKFSGKTFATAAKVVTRLMLYLHSSVVQSSTAHSNNNPGVLYYRIWHCGANIKSISLAIASNSWGH